MPTILKYLAKPRFGILCAALGWASGVAMANHDWLYAVVFLIGAPVTQVCLDILVDDLEDRAHDAE